MTTIYILLFSILLISCHESNNAKVISDNNAIKEVDTTSVIEETPMSIDYDKVKVLKTVFVTDVNGTDIKQSSAANTKILGHYSYGEQLKVIEDANEWLGIMARISREYMKGDTKIQSTAWEKIYVLKEATGSVYDVKLWPKQLNIISSIHEPDVNTKFYEEDILLKKYLTVELVTEAEYKKQKSTAVNFLISDTLNIRKTDGITTLPCTDKPVIFTDKPDAEESMCVFVYMGQIPELNKYLIGGSYWEEGDVTLVDKTTGEQLQIDDLPYLSSDKQHLISVAANPYETTADLELYHIENKNIKNIVAISFKNWMPLTQENDRDKPDNMFWGTDNCFYLKALHAKAFWLENGHLNNQGQYLRIKLL
ncbi:SH3 domain-containing protein [Sphingobacterium sp. SRCM116780]|uniref:SH3 domain-containing protein n=1 Tax=Sphingobacterium sp. SRCM116780 TaxID=2907623 RepID=UPI001F242C7E|nr:SH3 domain-containing protein [Sphingobacterium sp. SRCM116780]UIR57292.1 SH3 domain-containing protein [Sphingobacterium sp. SRCM116780]